MFNYMQWKLFIWNIGSEEFGNFYQLGFILCFSFFWNNTLYRKHIHRMHADHSHHVDPVIKFSHLFTKIAGILKTTKRKKYNRE